MNRHQAASTTYHRLMQVEQAIFTSARTAKMHGYHLVARSAGIDERLAGVLSQWGPSHASLLSSDLDAASLSFFPADTERFVLARTVYGGPEYSGRGGLEIVTRMFLLDREQFRGFDDNPVLLAHCALTLGFLRLPTDVSDELPRIDLPDTSLLGLLARRPQGSVPEPLLSELLDVLESGRRAAVVGTNEPLSVLEQLTSAVPRRWRLDVSFTTGLRPSIHRPFRLHFFPEMDESLGRQLASQGICCIRVAEKVADG